MGNMLYMFQCIQGDSNRCYLPCKTPRHPLPRIKRFYTFLKSLQSHK